MQRIEQEAGPPELPPLDAKGIDQHRRRDYVSFETWLRKRLLTLDRERPQRWNRDYASLSSYRKSIEPMRNRLKAMLGFWVEPSERPAVRVRNVEILSSAKDFVARRFRIEIADGLETHAVDMTPNTPGPHPGLVAQHGYGGTPEELCGFTANCNSAECSYRSLGLRAVRRGYRVLALYHSAAYGSLETRLLTVPVPRAAGSSRNGQNRLHRLALLGGGTLLGLFLYASSRGIDFLETTGEIDPNRIAMYGLSQGGMCTLFLAALDERIRASVCSGYFCHRLTRLIGSSRSVSYTHLRAHET